jgi:hypothetical protein
MVRYNATMENNAAPGAPESNRIPRAWPRVRFRLRTLVLLPVVVAALLLIAFPKLLTGDFVKATVVSIEHHDGEVRIVMDARISRGTTQGATLYGGYFGTLVVSNKSRPDWTDIIPTWPRHETLLVNLGIRDNSAAEMGDPTAMLTIQQGETFHVTPGHPFDLAPNSCQMKVWRGSRLGL